MYDLISSVIQKEIKKQNELSYTNKIDKIYILILYTKYLCDKQKFNMNYEEIIEKEDSKFYFAKLKEIKELKKFLYILHNLEKSNLNKIIGMIRHASLKDLIMDFLKEKKSKQKDIIEIFKKREDKILYVDLLDNYDNYNPLEEFATYVSNGLNKMQLITYDEYRLLDEMLGLKKTYVDSLDDISISDYDLIIINDESTIYSYNQNQRNIAREIHNVFFTFAPLKGKIILKTQYRKVSKFKSESLIKNNLSKIIFYDEKNPYTIMVLENRKEDKISLIMMNEKLSQDLEILKSLIEKNESKRDILFKVKPSDIIDNNNRLGFKMYQPKSKSKIKEINILIDDNNKLTEKLEELDKKIEAEINKLMLN